MDQDYEMPVLEFNEFRCGVIGVNKNGYFPAKKTASVYNKTIGMESI